jgi:hypothetical protein
VSRLLIAAIAAVVLMTLPNPRGHANGLKAGGQVSIDNAIGPAISIRQMPQTEAAKPTIWELVAALLAVASLVSKDYVPTTPVIPRIASKSKAGRSSRCKRGRRK